MTAVACLTNETQELLKKNLEVRSHPAWCGPIDEEWSINLLQHQAPMTYLLRQDAYRENEYWLSYKESSGTIRHRHFSLRLFPDGWFFANFRAPKSQILHDFIEGALACAEWE